jgi:two-component system OmpR family sensor kinase
MRQVGVPELAFWTCFGVLVSVSAAYGMVFALFVSHDGALNLPVRGSTAWSIAGACWVFALYPIWLIARLESRWIRRRVQEPIAALIQQCEKIRDNSGLARLRHDRSEVERDRCDDDIERLTVAVNEVLGRFHQIVVSQHQFTADAAHELRTPLTAQSLVGENALARRCTSTELREVVGSMLEESKHMKRLIESLLELTRASVTTVAEAECESERVPSPLDLSDLARDCVESLTVLAEEKGQRIELAARPVWADADPTMVRQAILNVIHNSIEHCPAGARIHVETARFARNQAMLRVTDTGPGIALDEQEHVFERFYRRSTAGGHRGLGLGLAIAKAVLKSQRGSIHLRSEPGAGACFTLVLPLLIDRSGRAMLRCSARPSASSESL